MYEYVTSHGPFFFWAGVCIIYLIAVRVKKALRPVHKRIFYVKTNFFHELPGERRDGICSYYTEAAIQEKAKLHGLNLQDYIRKNNPGFELDGLEPLSREEVQTHWIPARLTVSKKSLETKKAILFHLDSRLSVIIIYRPKGEDPLTANWFGICIQSDDIRTYKRIYRKNKKKVENGTCDMLF